MIHIFLNISTQGSHCFVFPDNVPDDPSGAPSSEVRKADILMLLYTNATTAHWVGL